MLKRSPRKLLALLFASLLACGQMAPNATAATQGTQALDFSLRTVDGGNITSEMLRGDVVVLAFGATWLPLSRAQVEGVQQLADEFQGKPVHVYWVSTDSESAKSKNYASDEQLRAFAKKNRLKVAVLRDPDGVLFKRLGVAQDQLPAVVILDRQGNIDGATIGGLDTGPEGKVIQQLSARLNKLL